MMIEDDTGFVLHARAYRETSLLVEVLSAQHGRIGLLARGVSTAKGQVLRAALQPLQWIRFSAQQRGNWPSCVAPRRWMPRHAWSGRRCWPAST